MNDPLYVVLATVWFVGCLTALTLGRGLPRLAGGLLLAQLVLEYFGWMVAPALITRPAGNVSGVLLAIFFVWATFAARSRWAAVAAGGQLMSVAVHAVRSLLPAVQMWAFVTARDAFGFTVLGAVVAGAWTTRRRSA